MVDADGAGNREKTAGGPATILIVEDERIVALELQDRLRRMGHRVAEIASTGAEAIEECRRAQPDLVLMDIKLQGPMDGIEAATAIRRESDVAIVYLTAFADDETLQRAKVTQPSGYLIKPFHDRELHVVIEVSLYRQRAERSLRESELWRTAVLRSVGDAVIASDAQGRVKFMNPRAEALTGWTEAQAIGNALDDVFHPVQQPERRIGAWSDPASFKLTSRDGRERPIELEMTAIGVAMGTVCVFRDISARIRTRDRQRLLTVASSELSASLDRDVVLSRVTNLVARCFGDWCLIHLAGGHGEVRVGAFADRAGTPPAQLVGAALRDPGSTVIGEVVRTRHAQRIDQIVDLSALGLDLVAAAAIVVPMCARDQCVGTFTVARLRRDQPFDAGDVEILEELGRRLAYSIDNAGLYTSAQRATSLRDDVLAIVSHDLRNPLSTISMGADQLLRMPQKADEERIARNATRIKRNVARMENLIDDLLEVGRVDSGRLSLDLQRIDVEVLGADAIASFEPVATERSIHLECSPLPAVEVLCDRGRIMQVFSNLIENAVKFSPDGAVIRVDGALAGDFLEFSVSDQGPGIAAEQLERIFERYWQAPEARHRGSGLGLYIARGVVEAHSGHIWAESTPGAGSTFHFTVPLAPSVRGGDVQAAGR